MFVNIQQAAAQLPALSLCPYPLHVGLPPSQRGTQQAQRLAGAGGAFQQCIL